MAASPRRIPAGGGVAAADPRGSPAALGTPATQALAAYDDLSFATTADGGHGELAEYHRDGRKDRDPRAILTGPYCARTGKGKGARFAINKLPESQGLRGKSTVDPEMPLFLDNTEIESNDWRLGEWVQCFDGIEIKKIMVEPYMLARGAGARGPTEVVRLMQRNLKRPPVLYFCLQAISKFELRETEMGLASKEATACILQTLKVLTRYPRIPALVGTRLRALTRPRPVL